jgi:hypothetical protein
MILVGNVAKIGNNISQFGKVEVLNIDGETS